MLDQIRFLARLIARPVHTGAVAPSSRALGRAMAREVDLKSGLPVLELGPGTGVVTEALLDRGIAPARLTAVEYDSGFAARVRERCPGVQVIEGDAFNLEKTLDGRLSGPLAAVVSSLPLVNFPMAMRTGLLDDIFRRLAPGAPFIQFSYRIRPPVPAPQGVDLKQAAVIWLNLPPARVWVYRRQ